MLGFILGAVFGCIVGMFAICLCVAAGQADKRKTAQVRTNNFIEFGDTI